MFPLNYSVEFFAAGTDSEPTYHDLFRYFHLEIAVSCGFWVIVYLVKAAFLALYYELFAVSRKFKAAWWPVCVFTFITFWICFVATFWACGTLGDLFNVGEYSILSST